MDKEGAIRIDNEILLGHEKNGGKGPLQRHRWMQGWIHTLVGRANVFLEILPGQDLTLGFWGQALG